MSRELIRRKTAPARRRFTWEGNTMTFPRQLRDAIPELPTCVGRVLQLAEVDVHSSNTVVGTRVAVRFEVRETGKLEGVFPVRMDLDPAAARAFAEALRAAADEAERG
jgi:hypothetical protein